MRRASTVCITPTGANSSRSAAWNWVNSAASSCGSTTYFCARSPCLSAFFDERALPSGVLGPRDFAPFLRLASARAWDTGTAARAIARSGWGAGPQPRSERAIQYGTWRSFLWREGVVAGGAGEGSRRRRPGGCRWRPAAGPALSKPHCNRIRNVVQYLAAPSLPATPSLLARPSSIVRRGRSGTNQNDLEIPKIRQAKTSARRK